MRVLAFLSKGKKRKRKRKRKQHSSNIRRSNHISLPCHHRGEQQHHNRLHSLHTTKGINRLYEVMQIAHLPKCLKGKHFNRYYLRLSDDNVNATSRIDNHTLHLLVKPHMLLQQAQKKTHWMVKIKVVQRASSSSSNNSVIIPLHMQQAVKVKKAVQALAITQVTHIRLPDMMHPWSVYWIMRHAPLLIVHSVSTDRAYSNTLN